MNAVTNYTGITVMFLDILESVIPRTLMLEGLAKEMQGGGAGFAEAVGKILKYNVPDVTDEAIDEMMEMLKGIRSAVADDQAELGIIPRTVGST